MRYIVETPPNIGIGLMLEFSPCAEGEAGDHLDQELKSGHPHHDMEGRGFVPKGLYLHRNLCLCSLFLHCSFTTLAAAEDNVDMLSLNRDVMPRLQARCTIWRR